jgi:hypothetical protein
MIKNEEERWRFDMKNVFVLPLFVFCVMAAAQA